MSEFDGSLKNRMSARVMILVRREVEHLVHLQLHMAKKKAPMQRCVMSLLKLDMADDIKWQ